MVALAESPPSSLSFQAEESAEALRVSPQEALGLSGNYYFSQSVFQDERRSIFAKRWTPVAFESDVEHVGDAFPISFALWELLVVRGGDGEIRCFHNICRHRGMKLVDQKTNVRKILCPYHCWGYDLEGSLASTPNIAGIGRHEADGIRRAELGLLGVRCATWSGVIFVNIDGHAAPLDGAATAIGERLASFDFSLLESEEPIRVLDVNANWKIVVEAGIEDYHLPYIHGETLTSYSENYKPERVGNVFLGFSQRRPIAEARARYRGAIADSDAPLPMWPSVEESGYADSIGLFLLPLGVVLLTPTMVNVTAFLPQSPERTISRTKTWFIGEGATSAKYQAARRANQIFFAKVMEEDIAAMECLQRMSHVRDDLGLQTRFSPYWERSLHEFQKYYIGGLTC